MTPRPASRVTGGRAERGIVLVFTAMCMIMALTFVALVVDVGYAQQHRRQAQATADAAALAAAQDLNGSSGQLGTAIATAKAYAVANLPSLQGVTWTCTDAGRLAHAPPTGGGCISFDSSSAPTRVRVALPVTTTPAFFGRVAGRETFEVSAAATARRTAPTVSSPASPCGLCVIGGRRLQMASVREVAVTGGEIRADRLTMNASDSLPASAVRPLPLRWYNGNESNWGRNVQPAPATFNGRYSQLSAPVPNPFEGRTVSYTGLTVDQSGNPRYCNSWGSLVLRPNVIYRQSVNVECGTAVLAAGTYYFAGTLNVRNGATLRGTGVTLVFGCTQACTGEGGKFDFNGGNVEITAPDSGPYSGMAIMFDPGNASGTPNQLGGRVTLNGAVYARRAGFNMGRSDAVVTAWTFVAGADVDLNAGTLRIDNTRLGGGGTPGAPAAGGSISLER